jgi:N,N-dimethylformamidase beta subunit-like protein/concanavalin A-like lectin/glucanase superfamily protein
VTADAVHALRSTAVTGYVQSPWCTAGDSVELMLGGTEAELPLSVVRLRHGDPSPSGPGLLYDTVSWDVPERVDARDHALNLGSYASIPTLPPLQGGAGTIAVHLRPTLVRGGWHAIAVRLPLAGELGFALLIGGQGILAGCAVAADGREVWISSPEAVAVGRWQSAALAIDPTGGELRLTHRIDGSVLSRAVALTGYEGTGTGAPLLFGAAPDPAARTDGALRHYFNGSLARPVVLGGALSAADAAELLHDGEPPLAVPVVGRWACGEQVQGRTLVDRSPSAAHGVLHNAPARAIPGPDWVARDAARYQDSPQTYDAVRLHEDDLDDARWPPAATLDVPTDAAPGIYAARIDDGQHGLWLPFVVARPRPAAPALALIPTLTWQAYSSNRRPFTWSEDGVIDAGVALYDQHADGSPVYYATARRPHRAGPPDRGFAAYGAHNITANLYLIDWLRQLGIEHDVAADQHLHAQGADLLSSYRCLILGSHPEYWTAAMLAALVAYLDHGGRVMYLGANGLYWVTSIDPERPWLIEVRKRGEGDFADGTGALPGESVHSTTLEVGGTWASRGIPPRDIVGVEFAANAHPHTIRGPVAFERTAASRDPRYRWVFEGVGENEPIGGVGAGAAGAGYEMDAVWPPALPGMESAVLLARARDPGFYGPRRVPVEPAADLALRLLDRGGAVFAAGSVTWTALLSHDDYQGSVSRITENVLRRFIETPDGESVSDGAYPD